MGGGKGEGISPLGSLIRSGACFLEIRAVPSADMLEVGRVAGMRFKWFAALRTQKRLVGQFEI